MVLLALDMVHPNVFPKPIVSQDAKHVDVKKGGCWQPFTNGQKFEYRDHML